MCLIKQNYFICYNFKKSIYMQLTSFIFKLNLFTALFSIIISLLIAIFFQYKNFEKDTEQLKKEFLSKKKEEVKREVDRIFFQIEKEYQLIKKNKLSEKEILKIQSKLLERIASIRFDKNGYIFINTLEETALVTSGKKVQGIQPVPYKKSYLQQLEAIKTKEGNFILTEFEKLSGKKKYDKITFVKLYDKWGWIIGSGAYLDEINNEIQSKKDNFENTLINIIKYMVLFSILIFIALYIFSKRIYRFIHKNINDLLKAFKLASKENKPIDSSNITYSEFNLLAENINHILKNKNLTDKKLQNYLKILDDNVIISTTNKSGIIKDVSNAFCKVSGYKKEELISKTNKILQHPSTPKQTYKKIWSNLNKGIPWRGELQNVTKNGGSYWIDTIIQPTFENAKITGYTSISHDITDKKKVEYLSITDELTQLYNRRYFNITIEKEINRVKRTNDYITFMMIDIDYFKNYNDTYGHQAGDITLKEIALLLKEQVKRVSDYAFRLGGEEFALLFSLNDEEKSLTFAQNIRKSIEKLAIKHEGSKINPYVTISIGLVCKKGLDINDSNELYRLADEALYKAKEKGRNCVILSS